MSELALRRSAEVVAFPGGTQARGGLAVDLCSAHGSARWLRGLLTLAALISAAIIAGARITPVDAPAAPPLAPEALMDLETDPLALGAVGRGEAVAPAKSVLRLAEPPERPRIQLVARVAREGGFAAALARAGVGAEDARAAVSLAGGAADLDSLKAGLPIDLTLGRRETKSVPRPLEKLAFRAAFDLKLELSRAADGSLALTRIPIAIDRTPLRIEGRVGRDFWDSAEALGMPEPIADQIARLLAYRIDFERDVRGSDRFVAVIEHARAETGETVTGKLLYAKLERSRADDIEMLPWSFGGREAWFLSDGSSVKKGLMGTPVAGARLTSGFGLRMHPILGYSRFHQGVDFGAPSGAPILAAASGRVSFAGWHGGHGNYVKIEHGRGFATAYGHMSRIVAKPGQMVQQGQLIGMVGSTGLSTGPHLHFEAWQGGAPVNPRSAKFVSGPQLGGPALQRFRATLDRMRSAGRAPARVAAARTGGAAGAAGAAGA